MVTNQFDYVHTKGEGNKGVSYKPTWKPDIRSPPGVKQSRVFLQVAAVLALAAIPVWVLPALKSGQEEEKKESMYARIKQRNREERIKWAQSDEMPYK